MNIPKLAIEKAVEGGWREKGYVTVHDSRVEIDHSPSITQAELSTITLDPTFWQALGKSLDWDADGVAFNFHEFCSLIFINGDTQQFWDDHLNH